VLPSPDIAMETWEMFLTAPLPTSLPPCRVQTPPLAEPFEAQLGKVGGEAFEESP
jgi:hypothetical protein